MRTSKEALLFSLALIGSGINLWLFVSSFYREEIAWINLLLMIMFVFMFLIFDSKKLKGGK